MLLLLVPAAVLAIDPPLKTLRVGSPTSHVRGMAFSPVDGTLLATVTDNWDEGLTLWNVTTMTKIKTTPGYERCHSRSLAFSPDGSLLAAGACITSQITLWNIPSCSRNRILNNGANQPVRALAFSPDGKLLATIDNGKSFRLWDLQTNKQVWEVHSNDGAWFESVAFSPNGNRVVAGKSDRTIRVLDVVQRKEVGVIHGRNGMFRDVVFSPDGTRLASAENGGSVRQWDATTLTEIKTPRNNHIFGALWVRYSPDGKLLVSTGRKLKIYVASTGQQIRTLTPDLSWSIDSVAFSPDGTLLAVESREDKTIKLWSVASLSSVSEKHSKLKPQLDAKKPMIVRRFSTDDDAGTGIPQKHGVSEERRQAKVADADI